MLNTWSQLPQCVGCGRDRDKLEVGVSRFWRAAKWTTWGGHVPLTWLAVIMTQLRHEGSFKSNVILPLQNSYMV